MQIESRLQAMGITLPDLGKKGTPGLAEVNYYGQLYGKMKPFHRSGNLLVLSGHVPDLLNRDPTAEPLVLAQPDAAHPAAPDFPEHAVATRDGPLRHLTSFHLATTTHARRSQAREPALPENWNMF